MSSIKPDVSDKTVKGTANKNFFITMLVKDITLRDAIGDLIDNSVDGAKRNATNPENLSKYHVNIHANANKFEIFDNCGGIEVNIAQEYAFQFGRPTKYKSGDFSIGQFGIGMKRAFFKIGNNIKVKSIAPLSSFTLEIDVEKWRKDEANWDFELSEKSITKNIASKCGTEVTITTLLKETKDIFNEKTIFFKTLINEIQREHMYSLSKGLQISINDIPLQAPNLTFINNDKFKPGYWSHKFANGLKVDVYAGISDDKGLEGGWYIFCNERLISGPDTSSDTGWTGKGRDGVAEYHDQFHRFRGYVFFSAKESSILPWNTTKTGMNLDAPEYKFVRQQMIVMMRPVMTFMNAVKKEKEKDTPVNERPLNNLLSKSQPQSISKVIEVKQKLDQVFQFPKIAPKKNKIAGDGTIKYYRPYEKIDKVKEHFNVTTLQEVGEQTFDYFFRNEIGE